MACHAIDLYSSHRPAHVMVVSLSFQMDGFGGAHNHEIIQGGDRADGQAIELDVFIPVNINKDWSYG